jgi:hypothetical protein
LPSKKDREDQDDDEIKGKEVDKKLAPLDTETKLRRLGELAGVIDYYRNQSSSLLFANLARMDEIVKATTADYSKVLDGWEELVEKVHEVKTSPKIAESLRALLRASSSRNPWRVLSLTAGFIAIAVLIGALYVLPSNWFFPAVIVAFVLLFGLQFYGTYRMRKVSQRNIESINKYGGTQIMGLSEMCKDLTQTIITTLTRELPKYGKASDTYTLTLLSNDYSNVKLRVQEKVKKGRRRGDLYSIVWK